MLVWAGREEGALAVLAGTPRGGPGDLRAPLMAAEIERRRGRPAEAARIVREAVRAAPLDPATRALALAAADGGLDGAAALHALGLVVQETGVPIVPGLVTQVKDDLPRCALDYHQRALALDPGHRGAATSAAATLELAGMAEFAVPFHAAAVRAAPADPGARAGLGRALARSYRLEEAGHQGRVLDALAGRPVRGGSPPERAAAYREALTALVASPAPPHPPMALRPPAG
jgi:predicted Zn-dependent protease